MRFNADREYWCAKGHHLAEEPFPYQFDPSSPALKQLHPAIDVLDEELYFGVYAPCRYLDGRVRAGLVFLNNSGAVVVPDELRERGIEIAPRPIRFPSRISVETLKHIAERKVPISEAFSAAREKLTRFLEFSNDDVYDFLAVWIIGTWFFVLFNAFSYLYVGGLKRCGKTKLLTVLYCLCFNAVPSSNISTSSLFRSIEAWRCTLLLDETEKLRNPERSEDLRSALLSGYKRGMPVIRTHKEALVPETFDVYSPKAIANIRGLDDVLEDRCVTIIMQRGANKAILDREPDITNLEWQNTRDLLYASALSSWRVVRDAYQSLTDPDITGRDFELWRPILALAKVIAQPLYERLRTFALVKVRERQIESVSESGEMLLIQALVGLVDQNSDAWWTIAAVKEQLLAKFDEEHSWITNDWVGRALKRLGFSERRRVGPNRQVRLTREAVLTLAQRHGMIEDVSVSNAGASGVSGASGTPHAPDAPLAPLLETRSPTHPSTADQFANFQAGKLEALRKAIEAAVRKETQLVGYGVMAKIAYNVERELPGATVDEVKDVLGRLESEGRVFQIPDKAGCWRSS